MKYESVAQMFQRYHNHKKNGVKHTPLHTLQECCEEAGIDPRLFGRYAAQHPNAPQPVLNSAKNVGRGAVKYYRKHEFVQWVNQVRQQKEKAMPDIKTALQQALSKTANTWAADDEAHQKIAPVPVTPPKDTAVPKKYFQTTNNVTRATFDHVYKNPGKTRKEIVTALESQGYKRASTTSLIGQFVRSGAMVERGDILFTTQPDYTPLKSTIRKKVAAVAPVKPVKAVAAGLASIAPIAEAALQRKHIELVSKRTGEIINPRKEEWTVESVIDKLSVKQARALYDELRKIFGG